MIYALLADFNRNFCLYKSFEAYYNLLKTILVLFSHTYQLNSFSFLCTDFKTVVVVAKCNQHILRLLPDRVGFLFKTLA